MGRGMVFSFGAALVAGACGHDFEPPDRAERVREAEAQYSVTMFDSVSWSADSVRDFQGNTVYAEKCRRCHGTMGRGDTEYARERRLEMPSLVEPDWPLAALDTLRHVVYVGHEEGMPVFGKAGITPREIDAVSFYLVHTLRPDVLGAAGGAPDERE